MKFQNIQDSKPKGGAIVVDMDQLFDTYIRQLNILEEDINTNNKKTKIKIITPIKSDEI